MQKLIHVSCLCALGVAALAGCGTTAAPTTSSITGTIDQQSFAKPVTQITIVSDKGSSASPVAADGKFELLLKPGAKYHFVLAADGSTPIMTRATAKGRLDTTVNVLSAGAHFDLGKVQYWPGAAGNVPPPVASQEAAGACEDMGDDDNNECEDGIDPNTGAECDGGPAANQDGGQDEDAAEDTDCSVDDEMGLPELNLPDSIGCESGDEAD